MSYSEGCTISQNDIVAFLTRHRGKKYSARALSKYIYYKPRVANGALSKLVHFGFIKEDYITTKLTHQVNGRKYVCSRRIRRVWVD